MSLTRLVPVAYLKKFEISPEQDAQILKDLRMLGISHSSLFPDLDGLTQDSGRAFQRDRKTRNEREPQRSL